MKQLIFIIISTLCVILLNAQKINLAPSKPVTDNYFGTEVVDEYRNLENLDDPKTLNWMKSQTDYTSSILDLIPNRNYYLEKRIEFDKRQGYSISDLKITSSDKYFYLKKNGNEKVAKLYYRDGFLGEDKLLYDPSDYKKNENNHDFIINYINPSWDGNTIVISMAEKGNELSEVIIMDVKTKKVRSEIITNVDPVSSGGIKWLDDNSGFIYLYYPTSNSKSRDFYKNSQSVLYKIGTDPKKINDVFSRRNNPDLNIAEDQFPIILDFEKDDQYYIGMIVDYDYFRKTFIIEKKDLLKGKKKLEITL